MLFATPKGTKIAHQLNKLTFDLRPLANFAKLWYLKRVAYLKRR